jgi:uncharacterized protein (DUF58 family)
MNALVPERKQAAARPRGRMPFALTPRALILLSAGIGWIILAFFAKILISACVAWDLTVLVLAIIDGLRLPGAGDLVVSRTWLSAPAIGQMATIEIGVRHSGARVLVLHILDDLPAALAAAPEDLRLESWPRTESTVRYAICPQERGDHRAGSIYIRCRSRIGLAERWTVADLSQTVRVFPRVSRADEDSLFLARSRQIEMQKRKEQLRGQGREFESLREYREGGDDLREVCWTASARRGTLICRQYQVERSQPVWLVLDSGRLLNARSGPYTRLDYTTSAALAVGQIALLSGDRVGLIGYGQTVQQRVPLGRGKTHFRSLMDATAVLHTEPGEAAHTFAAASLAHWQPTRSLILWFTDLAETTMRPEVIDGAFQLMRRHLLLFVVPAPEEIIGLIEQQPRNASQMFERTAAQEMLQRRELLLAQLRARGALTLQVPAAQIATAVLNRYLEVKEASLL